MPGVQEEAFPESLPRVALCVRTVQLDASCGDVLDKCSTQCENGLRCKKGTCVKAEEDDVVLFDEPVMHGGQRAFCEDLRCVPGLVWERDESDSWKVRVPCGSCFV